MIKVAKILNAEPYTLTCLFTNGKTGKLDILPLIEKHSHLDGIEKLLDKDFFSKVRVGNLGEIVWDKVISITRNNETILWDYDISPGFALQEAY